MSQTEMAEVVDLRSSSFPASPREVGKRMVSALIDHVVITRRLKGIKIIRGFYDNSRVKRIL